MTNPFYSSEQTDQSRGVLDAVLRETPTAILVGGWGTWVRTGGAMSHDIDLILTRPELSQLATITDEMSQSRHVAGVKWRASWRGIHLELYVAHQSRLGANLQLRVERLVNHIETINGYRLLTIPAHLATKIAALLDRPDSLPGRKDRDEILALLAHPHARDTPDVIRDASTRTPAEIDTLLAQCFGFLAETDRLTRTDRNRLRATATRWHEPPTGHPNPGLGR